MNFNKKCIISSLMIILVVATSGCSNASKNKAKENTSKTAIANSANSEVKSNITIDEDVRKYYDDYVKGMDEYLKTVKDKKEIEYFKKLFDKREKNIPIFMELNQKAKNSRLKGYYVEYTTTDSVNKGSKKQGKLYVSNGNSRSEEYYNGKSSYLNIYSKDDDTFYKYDVAKDAFKKITAYSTKNNGGYPYKLGFFDVISNNALSGDMKYIDYEGKKVLYSSSKFGDSTSNNWFDAETGAMIKYEQITFKKDKTIESTLTTNYSIKFNQSYGKDVFTFDKNKLSK